MAKKTAKKAAGSAGLFVKMDTAAAETPEQLEIDRLTALYQGLPPKQFALAQGLIIQAARLRVRLDKLWAELLEKGETEWFTQSDKTDPYERERPASRTFTATDKSYQSIIKQLNDMLPADKETASGLELDLSDV